MNFRKDINGLRALSIIAVVMFHFNVPFFQGGFAGVDVFFVISGYLMTSIIFRGIENESFSFSRFYVARANRIIPALSVLCLVLLVFGWFYLIPVDFKALGKHVLGSILFVSNQVYLLESGYFDSSSLSKWLLHTWSLSVEWQFYIVYPIILVFLAKSFSVKVAKIAVVVLTLLSFFVCTHISYNNVSVAYYILPTRAWEMLVGGIACIYPLHLSNRQKNITGSVGIALIVTSCLFMSKENVWPGYLAVIPVVGAYLVIQSNCSNNLIFNNKLIQKIGLYSYSIYLWHWPLVVAMYYFSIPTTFTFILVILSVFIGHLSYTYIEKLNLNKSFSNFRSLFFCKPLLISFIIASLGLVILLKNGIYERLSKEELYFNHFSKIENDLFNQPTLTTSCNGHDYLTDVNCKRLEKVNYTPDAIILGDSHSVAIAPGVYKSMIKKRSEGKIINAGAAGCIPIRNMIHTEESRAGCKNYVDSTYEIIHKKFSGVPLILLSRFNLYFHGFNEKGEIENPYMYLNERRFNDAYRDGFEKQFLTDICSLSKSNPVYILNPVPEFGYSVPNRMIRNSFLNKDFSISVSKQEVDQRNAYTSLILEKAKSECGVSILNANPMLLLGENYIGSIDGKPLYRDDNHLNVFGASIISSVFDDIW